MGSMSSMVSKNGEIGQEAFAIIPELMEQRRKDPQDDLLTGLVHAEIEEDGKTRTLTLEEILGFVQLISLAGTETVARLLGFAAVTLAQHPDQRQELVDDPSLLGERGRGAAALRSAVAGAVAVGRRATSSCTASPSRRARASRLLNGCGRPRRAPLPRPRPVRHPPRHRPAARVRVRRALLHRRRGGTARRHASRCTRR